MKTAIINNNNNCTGIDNIIYSISFSYKIGTLIEYGLKMKIRLVNKLYLPRSLNSFITVGLASTSII